LTAIPAAIFDPQLSPITTPVIHSSEIPAEPPSAGSTDISSGHTHHMLDSPPPESSTETYSRTLPWPSSVLFSPVMPSNRVHGYTSEMEGTIPMVVLSDTSQSSSPLSSPLAFGSRTPRPDDTPHGQGQGRL
jgi:hypothetical protein